MTALLSLQRNDSFGSSQQFSVRSATDGMSLPSHNPRRGPSCWIKRWTTRLLGVSAVAAMDPFYGGRTVAKKKAAKKKAAKKKKK